MRFSSGLATITFAGGLAIGLGTGVASADPHSPTTTTVSAQPPEQIVRVSSQEFRWGDAAIGAAAALGVSMIAVGGVLIITTARRPGQPSPSHTEPSNTSAQEWSPIKPVHQGVSEINTVQQEGMTQP
jgi:hypothetical protein